MPPCLPGDVAAAFLERRAAVAEVLDTWVAEYGFKVGEQLMASKLQRGSVRGHNFTFLTFALDRDANFDKWTRELETYNETLAAAARGSLVLDVGANVGFFAIVAARLCPGVRVVSFEASPENRLYLELNVALNGAGDSAGTAAVDGAGAPAPGGAGAGGANVPSSGAVEVRDKALGERSGDLRMVFHNSLDGLVSNLFQDPYHLAPEYNRRYLALTVSLDDVLSDFPDHKAVLLKLDCEGCEFEVLRGASIAALDRLTHVGGEYHEEAAKLYGAEADAVTAVMCGRRWRMLHLRC